jgi:hypothetical protein
MDRPFNGSGSVVRDNDSDVWGPALLFWDIVEKTVIVPEDGLNSSSTTTVPLTRALPGEKPWFCFWKRTVVEVLIYGTQNISNHSSSNTEIPYPQVVKFKETRVQEDTIQMPYCQQYQILDDGSAAPNTDKDGNPVILILAEKVGNTTTCGCEWVNE